VSRPELLAVLRESTPPAPEGLQRRVVELAEAAARPPNQRRWRRLAVAAVAFAVLVAAAIAGTLLAPGSSPPRPRAQGPALEVVPAQGQAPAAAGAAAPGVHRAAAPSFSSAAALPPPSSSRAQRYAATLRLRLGDGTEVATAARRAVAIAVALGGYPQAVSISVSAPSGSATIVLRVPRARVTEAVDRLSVLGAVVGERTSISDLQAGIDTTSLRIVRLERQLAAAIHAPSTPESQRLVAALTTQIEGLQRSRAATLRAAADATVSLALATPSRRHVHLAVHPAGRGHFHELGRLFRQIGVGAVYALALGTPLVVVALILWLLATRLGRRREERLLSRS
jgi:hypothetical protein